MIPRRPCSQVHRAAASLALCEAAAAVAGEGGEVLLLLGVAGRGKTLEASVASAVRAAGGRLLLLALDRPSEEAGARLGVATFRLSSPAEEGLAAPLASLVLLRAGMRAVLSTGAGGDPTGIWPGSGWDERDPARDLARDLNGDLTGDLTGVRAVPCAGASLLFSGDALGGLSRDTDVEVMSEGWDDVTAGGHVHGAGDEAMGWSG